MILNRDVAEIVAIYAQGAEHLANAAAALYAAGGGKCEKLADAAAKVSAYVEKIIEEEQQDFGALRRYVCVNAGCLRDYLAAPRPETEDEPMACPYCGGEANLA